MQNKRVHGMEILKKAREFVVKGWCNDGVAKYKNLHVNPCGDSVFTPNGKEIVTLPLQWSLTGAILAAEGSRYLFETDAYVYLQKAAKNHGFNYFADFEGARKRTQEECVALIDEALEIYHDEWAKDVVDYVNKRFP